MTPLATLAQSIPAPSDVQAAPKEAKRTPSGLAYKVIKPGTGKEHPTAASAVTVHYTGWTTDGKMFDSSIPKGKPSTFPVNRVIPGFSEGLQLMVAGETRRLWIPEALAYKGAEGKPKGVLVFDVHLIEMPNRAPADKTGDAAAGSRYTRRPRTRFQLGAGNGRGPCH